jgi:hypothetical protein
MKLSKKAGAIFLVSAMVLAGSVGRLAAQIDPAMIASLPKDIYPESGNRLPLPRRDDMNDADKKIFDDIMHDQLGGSYRSRGEERPSVRLHSPELAKGMEEAHRYLKYDTQLGPRALEVAILTTAREATNQYEWTQWLEHAQSPKDPRALEPVVVDTILNCKPVEGLAEKDAAIITFGRQMLGSRKVSSAAFADVLRLFGKRGTVDLVELMALYQATGDELVAFDMQLNKGQKPSLPESVRTSCGK